MRARSPVTLDAMSTQRQPTFGMIKNPAIAARATPTGSPACSAAEARPRSFASTASASMPCPMAHSPPTPRPTISLPKRKKPTVGASPLMSEPSE